MAHLDREIAGRARPVCEQHDLDAVELGAREHHRTPGMQRMIAVEGLRHDLRALDLAERHAGAQSANGLGIGGANSFASIRKTHDGRLDNHQPYVGRPYAASAIAFPTVSAVRSACLGVPISSPASE